ncbi:AraC family transcriptional regulator [Pandoraea sputorum]|uniref:AraC family transcriptional regulator n=1 Tax=Pandoraea sputorum TaxID=93222 RepID=UPI002AF6A4B7|nr:AraC family transcriptional regulator [Pandoraea sputorum]BET11215.1 AraC family transcriptional regulator [Pandoraea sputorum]
MAKVSVLPPNQVKLWREPSFANAELMVASYRTHQFPPHAHEEYAIGVIERGAQAYLDGRGRRAIMPEGTICVINPGSIHEGKPAIEGGWDYRMAYIPASDLLRLLKEHDPSLRGEFHFPDVVIDDAETMRFLLAAHRCSQSTDASRLEKSSRLTAAVFQLVVRHGGAAKGFRHAAAMPAGVRRAREFIDANVAENPSLDQLSDVACISAFHLLREFKRTIGITPHAYLVQRRVALAKGLLLRGLPLRQVALEVGYCDQGHLSREFRRFFGVPPRTAR